MDHLYKGATVTRAARSLFVFGTYLILLGVTLVLVPNALLRVFALPPTGEVWIRVVGVLVVILGAYNLQAARYRLIPMFRATVSARAAVVVPFIVFAAVGLVKPILVLFGVIDLLGATWTWLALRADGSPSAVQHTAGQA